MNHSPKRLFALAATTAIAVGGSVALATPANADVWDAVAKCESGGNWSINTGNGYHGGLQFSNSTWRAYGGTAYAPTAGQATKAQQIAIAKKVLQGQGPHAWPACSRKAGLTKANGGASGGTAAAPVQVATHWVKKSPAKTMKTKATKSTPSKVATARRGTTMNPVETTGKRFITVKPGDTLSELAVANHVKGGWRALWSLNKGKVADPNLIFVGQRLAIA